MKKEESLEEIRKDLAETQKRVDDKIDEFFRFLKKKDEEFKLMELEEAALKNNPNLKKVSH